MTRIIALAFSLAVVVAVCGQAQAERTVTSGAKADEAAPRIKCKVVDADGKPVAGAEVVVIDYGYEPDTVVGQAKVLERTTTDSGGEFSYARAAREGWPQRIALVRKPGLALGWLVDPTDRKIVLGKPQTVSGRVVDESGQPVAGAEVRVELTVVSSRDTLGFDAVRSLRLDTGLDWLTMRTDGDGRFTFSQAPENARVSLQVSAPGRAHMAVPAADAVAKPIVLPREATLRGKVVEKATGRPVGGVRLNAIHLEHHQPSLPTLEAESAPDGTFAIGGLVEGDCGLHLASHAGMPDWVADPITAKATVAPGPAAVVMEVVKGAVVQVAATDKRTGRPIAGATFDFQSPHEKVIWTASVVTGSDGVGRGRVWSGKYTMASVSAPHYVRDLGRTDFAVGEGDARRLEVSLQPQAPVEGTVRDEAGKPVEGAEVVLAWVPRETRFSGVRSTGVMLQGGTRNKTDEAGHFAIWSDYVADGKGTVDVVALACHEERGLAGAVVMGQDQNPVLTLQAGRSLAGRVVDLEGKPVAGAEVTATLFANPRWNGFTYAEVRTDRDGRYVIKALPQEPNCKASLWVSKQGYDSRDFSVVQAAPVLPTGFVKPGDTVWRTYAVPRVTLEDGRAVTESQDIMLEPADKTITGMVVDAAGKPVAGVHVKASYHAEMEAGSNSGLTMAESGTDGKFVLKGVSRGEYVLQAFSEDYSRQASAKAKGGDRDVRLTLGP